MNCTALILCLSMITLLSPTPGSDRFSGLDRAIDSLVAGHQGTFAVVVKDLQTGASYSRNEHVVFHAASTMKTPVMAELMRQVQIGKRSLDESVPVENVFHSIIDGSSYSLDPSDDSDPSLYHAIGTSVPMRDLLVRMITRSSNLATNLVIDCIGAENLMTLPDEMGLKNMKVLRGVEDTKAFRAGKNNVTSAADLAAFFERIAQHRLVSAPACDTMISILLQQEFRDMIPALLPNNVRVAHKTGSITNVQHDSGIVTLPDGRSYILILLSKELSSNDDGIRCLQQISRAVYDIMVH